MGCFARIDSGAFLGLDGVRVSVEIDVQPCEPDKSGLVIVGLPDAAVRESKDRVRAALRNSGYSISEERVTINLAPGDLRKEGVYYDLPIALGILVAKGIVQRQVYEKYLVIGELGLSGQTREISGALPMAMLALQEGKEGILLPSGNAKEASCIPNLQVIPVHDLKKLVGFLIGKTDISPEKPESGASLFHTAKTQIDFADVKGQDHAKRALEIAAAGGHNVLMSGPPGSGKSMLAKSMVGILPRMTMQEALETTKIHSIAGLVKPGQGLVGQRPFRSPHHTISYAGLIGGGQIPRPGEVSLAHHGVLFLDELAEFSRTVLEVLRQPLEDRQVTISRAHGNTTYPTSFICVTAMNPCPCGFLGHPTKPCRDTEAQIQKYRGKISGPLLDRIDIHLEVPALQYDELIAPAQGESSETVRERVEAARLLQHQRLGSHRTNSQMTPREVATYCQLSPLCQSMLQQAAESMGFSARAHHRILRVARTLADLDSSQEIQDGHLMEAVHYRQQEGQKTTAY